MNKKMALILGLSLFSVLVIILIVVAILNASKKTSVVPTPTPTPVALTTPRPTTIPTTAFNPSVTPHPQKELDFEAGAKQTYEKYPWLNSMPIQTDRFFVFFDTKTEKFTAKLYVTPDQEDNARTEIVSRLRILKVPLDKYPIEFIPKSQ